MFRNRGGTAEQFVVKDIETDDIHLAQPVYTGAEGL